MKTILIDDNSIDLSYLTDLCQKIENIKIVQTFTDELLALKWLKENKVDLILCDIEMPLINGIDLLKKIEQKPNIIFISSHAKYAIKSFEVNPDNYLIKPVSFNKLAIALSQLKTKKQTRDYIYILQNKIHLKLKLDDILYVNAEANFVTVITKTKSYLVLSNLTQFTSQLPNDQFLRIHKSTTINLTKIESFTMELVVLNKKPILIGAFYKEELMDKLNYLSIKRKG